MVARLDGLLTRRPAGSAGMNPNEVMARAVCTKAKAQHPSAGLAVGVFALYDDRAGAVTEQQGGIEVLRVERPRLDFGGSHETGFDLAASDHGISHRKPVQESGTRCRNIERRYAA